MWHEVVQLLILRIEDNGKGVKILYVLIPCHGFITILPEITSSELFNSLHDILL